MKSLKSNLNQLREEIDTLDNELISILAERMKVAEAVGKYKVENGLKPLDKKRWQTVLDSRIALGKKAGLPSTFVHSLFDIIHKHSLSIQKGLKP